MENKSPKLIIPPDTKIQFTFFSPSGEVIFKQSLANETLESIILPIHCPIEYERLEAVRIPLSKD